MKNLGLYIHIPYCKSKCYYCDFCSVKYIGQADRYMERLTEESRFVSRFLNDFSVDTVFIGGGTPTILPNGMLKKTFCEIVKNFNNDIVEFTVEANPDTVTEEKLTELRETGVNRLSIGIQTLNDKILQALNRPHGSIDAINAIRLAGKYFDNLSADIMLGLPEQSFEDIEYTVNTLIKSNVKHISCYTLQLEEKTVLKKMAEEKKIIIPSDDEAFEMYDYAYKLLKKHGFYRYEISNFALEGYECRHNYAYWTGKDYLGLGAAAHSLIDNTRFNNTDNISRYISKEKYQNITRLTLEELMFEAVMLGFRTASGIDLKAFSEKFHIEFTAKYANQLEKMKNYLNITATKAAIKEEYFEISNAIILEFMD